jgi:hypothetical protein
MVITTIFYHSDLAVLISIENTINIWWQNTTIKHYSICKIISTMSLS